MLMNRCRSDRRDCARRGPRLVHKSSTAAAGGAALTATTATIRTAAKITMPTIRGAIFTALLRHAQLVAGY
jgi:hypothetical protein